MISARKLRANRANSLSSTGPKTAAGRARSARNARRHGLRIPVMSDPTMVAEVEVMAQKIAGDGAPELIELARRVAEAEVDVLRIRRARNDVISRGLSDPNNRLPVGPLDLREEAYMWGRLYTIAAGGTVRVPNLYEMLTMMFGVPPLAVNLRSYRPQFDAFDRYERRALSRRKFAIRAFDKARAAK